MNTFYLTFAVEQLFKCLVPVGPVLLCSPLKRIQLLRQAHGFTYAEAREETKKWGLYKGTIQELVLEAVQALVPLSSPPHFPPKELLPSGIYLLKSLFHEIVRPGNNAYIQSCRIYVGKEEELSLCQSLSTKLSKVETVFFFSTKIVSGMLRMLIETAIAQKVPGTALQKSLIKYSTYIFIHILLYPLFTIKLKYFQHTLEEIPNSFGDCVKDIKQQRGILGFYDGLLLSLFNEIVYHSTLFGIKKSLAYRK